MLAVRLSSIFEMQDGIAAQPLSEIATIACVGFSQVARVAHRRIHASS
jgi:hypothetical protein